MTAQPDLPRTPFARRATLAAAGAALGIALALSGCSRATDPIPGDVSKLNHIVVIYLENRSFDNLYGEFAGADGLASAATAPKQVDSTGAVYATLPQTTGAPFPITPALPNAPFNIDQYLPADKPTRDLVHRFYQEQLQIDGGKMDKFATISDAKGLVMGYYHTAGLPLAAEAHQYTLADHFFHAAFGGSFLNHIFLVAATPAVFPGAPLTMVAQVDANGNVVKDGAVTSDGYVVNTAFSVNSPHPASASQANLVPNQTMPTIGDRLTEKGVTWAWYAGGWNAALAGTPDPTFQFHHQPFVYFAKYADGTAAKAEHLKDETDFIAAAHNGTLPAVAFVKPLGINNEHPGYAEIVSGENHVKALIDAIRSGPDWKDAAIVITYDENGGFWDHVAPPKADRWGPGTRVPAIIISPFAKRGFVDHSTYDTASILALIEKRFGLAPLGARDQSANPLSNAFDFSRRN